MVLCLVLTSLVVSAKTVVVVQSFSPTTLNNCTVLVMRKEVSDARFANPHIQQTRQDVGYCSLQVCMYRVLQPVRRVIPTISIHN